jgi:Prealbumin-like fold domain
MTNRILGRTGSKRRRRFLLATPLVALAALILALGSSAGNSPPPVNFELEGDLQAGVQNGGGGGTTVTGSDWVDGDAAGPGLGALMCSGGAVSCPAIVNADGVVTNVVDGPALGTGELFRDRLKVDPDNTTFTGGDKENDAGAASQVDPSCTTNCLLQSPVPWHVVTGSVPPQKDDLFDIATNTYVAGNQAELDLGMLRTNNNGSSHVDFELNRQDWTPGSTTDGSTCAQDLTGIANFKCPTRTEGDLLISFEISPSSTTPPVSVATRFFVWDLPGGTDANGKGRGNVDCQGPLSGNENTCPWEEIAPPAGVVLFGVNANEVDAGPWGSRMPNGSSTNRIPPGGWFEAAIDLDRAGFPPSCPGFGTGSAKSRSSGSSVTSSLTDLGGPFRLNLNTCAKIKIVKNTVPDGPQDFHYTTTGGLSPASFDLDDDADATLSNTRIYDPLNTGDYSVTEQLPVFGYALTDLSCTVDASNPTDPTTASGSTVTGTSTIHLGNNGAVTCTYTNTRQLGAIKITKTAKNKNLGSGDQPHAGVHFTIAGPGGPFDVVTNAQGVACKDGLEFGSYSVTEIVPTGYQADTTSPQPATVGASSTCGDGNEATVAFHNTPLTTITVDATSLAGAGVTVSTVQCTGEAAPSPTPHTTGSYVPGTVTCTIVIDP